MNIQNSLQISSQQLNLYNDNKIVTRETIVYEAIKSYLTSKDFFDSSFVNKCKQYHYSLVNKKNEYLHIHVDIDIQSILTQDWILGSMILENLEGSSYLFGDVIFETAKTVLGDSIARDQIYTVLKIKVQKYGLPVVLCPEETMRTNNMHTIVYCDGIVTSMSATLSYVSRTFYQCQNLCSSFNSHFPASGKAEITGQQYFCPFCFFLMVENKASRIYGEKMFVEISQMPQKSKPSKVVSMALKVCCRDEQIKKIVIGTKYGFVGTIRFETINNMLVPIIEANNILKLETLLQRLPPTCSFAQHFFNGSQYSDWRASCNMYSLFCNNIAPGSTYFGLKLITLLSLMKTFSQKKHSTLPILILAEDTHIVHQLFCQAGAFVQPFTKHSTNNPFFPSRHNSTKPEELSFLEVGSLSGTNFGIYMLSDIMLSSMKTQDLSLLCNAMESGSVIINSGKKNITSHNLVVPLKTTIWASMYFSKKPTQFDQSYDVFKCLSTQEGKIVRAFPLIFKMSVWEDETSKDEIAQIKIGCRRTTEESISGSCILKCQIEEYLDCAMRLEVSMSAKAKQLIQAYFETRRQNIQKHNIIFLPNSCLQTLISLSEAFAQLSLAEDVRVCHVVAAIILFEESLSIKTGSSILLDDDFTQSKNLFRKPLSDDEMKSFEEKICRFVAR